MLRCSRARGLPARLIIGLNCGVMALPALGQADVVRMLKDSNCVQCHHASRQRIGPSWSTIASRYKGSDARELLLRRIKEGSKDVHGTVPMPACFVGFDRCTEAEQRLIVDYILGF